MGRSEGRGIMVQKVTAVVGAQFGSEGKGAVVNVLAEQYGVHVRTGGPQAGHTIVHEGQEFKMRCIPCGWVNPKARLYIGPGGVVNPRQLEREIMMIELAGYSVKGRLFIDERATPLSLAHEGHEGHIKGELHTRLGSTGEGVGAARSDWLNRDSRRTETFGEYVTKHHESLGQYMYSDIPSALQFEYGQGESILFEGTQGYGLSLTHGYWPFVTSHDTTPAQLLADAGFPAQFLTDVIMVARTFPIRVAGNSGPLKDEMTWEEFCKHVGREIPREMTTVTRLPRRIGKWDHDIVSEACTVMAPTEIVLTFADYLFTDDTGVTEFAKLSEETRKFVAYIESCFAPVSMVGTGYSPNGGWVYCKKG